MEKAGKLAGGETGPLTNEQKARIADIRKKAEARIAESRIMLDDKIAKFRSHPGMETSINEAEENFRYEKAKIDEDTERKIEAIRRERAAS